MLPVRKHVEWMKYKNRKYPLLLLLACWWFFASFSQITPDELKLFIVENKNRDPGDVPFSPEIKEFYELSEYKTAWVQKENWGNCDILLNTLQQSAGIGLRETDYRVGYIKSFRKNPPPPENVIDLLKVEIRITDAALHFFHDIAYGNLSPALGYNGLNYSPGCKNIPGILATYISKNELQYLPVHLSPALPEIKALENKIEWLVAISANPVFREVTITSNKVSFTNKPLISKLHQLGIIDDANMLLPDSILKEKVKEVQLQFNTTSDGILCSFILKELNIPVSMRLQQLNISINYYRWLYCLAQNQPVIIVNIPAALLKVYRQNECILSMRMIVGKKSTPTPTLASIVHEVILYPYWHVPHSIATKELLPILRRNPGYIDEGNYQVLNRAGQVVNPYSINWRNVSSSYFPYILRQSTGCDNALGLIKLSFPSPFAVYLHDTPNKSLFKANRRFFSHGCMRMELPMEMGHLLLKYNSIAIDTLEEKGCLLNQAPVKVPVDELVPVIVWYNPAGTDSTGRVLYFEDIYGKFARIGNKINN